MIPLLFIVLYWYAEGMTEGATTLYRWENSRAYPSGKYHAWRFLEAVSIFGAVYSASLVLPSFTGLVGAWLLGYFAYNVAFMDVTKRETLASPYPYSICLFGKLFEFIIPSWFVWLSGLIGFALMILEL